MSTDCLKVPNADQVKGLVINYSGHGTSNNDVIIAVGITVAICLLLACVAIVTYLRYRR